MKLLSRTILLIGVLVISQEAALPDQYVRQDLEHARDVLLQKEDDLKRSYENTCAAIDQLNKQLDQLNARRSSIEAALQRNDQALKDLESSLRNSH